MLGNEAVVKEVNQQLGKNFLNEVSLLAVAETLGFSTAAVGKLGPVLIQDVTQEKGEVTIISDESIHYRLDKDKIRKYPAFTFTEILA
ncbi:hypothetical protein [Trichormus azollae]|uniref:hypothetical protein n=1 Tax=Trichormus azollae TaxID=1164 RepID=UPI00325F9E61